MNCRSVKDNTKVIKGYGQPTPAANF